MSEVKTLIKDGKVYIQIPLDFGSAVTLQNLKEDYSNLKNDIIALTNKKNFGTIKPHEEEDLKSDKKYLKAFKKVLKYYMTLDEWENFARWKS